MINKNLITPRNFLVITAMTVVAHIVARPVYNAINKDRN
jgi:hypothetical protein